MLNIDCLITKYHSFFSAKLEKAWIFVWDLEFLQLLNIFRSNFNESSIALCIPYGYFMICPRISRLKYRIRDAFNAENFRRLSLREKCEIITFCVLNQMTEFDP